MAQPSKRKNNKSFSKVRNRDVGSAVHTKRVSALGKHMERTRNKNKKK